MTRNAIVDALGVLKAGRIVDLTHLVHPGIQRFGPFPAMRTLKVVQNGHDTQVKMTF